MGDFRAIFLKIDGLEEDDLGVRELDARTLEDAKTEAQVCTRPAGTNMIVICRESQKVCRIGVGL